MKRYFLIFFFSFVFFHPSTLAIQGDCSLHRGIDCDIGSDWDGSVICNDGWRDSTDLYSDAVMCEKEGYYSGATRIIEQTESNLLNSVYLYNTYHDKESILKLLRMYRSSMSMLCNPVIIDSYYSGYLQASWGEVGIIHNTAQDYVAHIDYFIDRVEKSLPLAYEMVGDLSYKMEGDKKMTKIPLSNYPPKTKAELFMLMRGDEAHKWQD